jgi:hypothetical protein
MQKREGYGWARDPSFGCQSGQPQLAVRILGSQPPNFAVSSQRMASRWLAMISACQTSPIAIMLIATRQTAMTRVLCVSETGMRKQRVIQSMVRGLLVLGRYAVGPHARVAGGRDIRIASEHGQLKGQSNMSQRQLLGLQKSTGFRALGPPVVWMQTL